MKKFIYIFSALLGIFLISSCTSARWTVKNKDSIDRSDYVVLDQSQFLQSTGQPSPGNPVLTLDLLSRQKYRYTQRILAERSIQDYRLRPGFVAVGLTGAAAAFFVANSPAISTNQSTTQVWTLNAVGALLAASGFFNMEPAGDPRPTGEERLLKRSGETVQIDTVRVSEEVEGTASVTARYEGEVIYQEENRTISNTRLEISLADMVEDLQLRGRDPGFVAISVNYEDSLYSYRYPITDILEPYARITSQLTTLLNSPDDSSEDNIVAELVEGSQVKLINFDEGDWYRVLYGISEHFIRKDNAEIVWRPSDFTQENKIFTVPRLPFGDIDVESNIPILRPKNENALALIVTNQNYAAEGDLQERNYAHRDGRLIRTYLRNALGYSADNIFALTDIVNDNQLEKTLSQMRISANDSTEVTVFLSGYGRISDGDGNGLHLLGVGDEDEYESINLTELYNQFSTLTSEQILILNDIDFSASTSSNYSPVRAQEILEESTNRLVRQNKQAAILFGAQLNQPSSLYVSSAGDDKKHHIFPYFFAKALQQRITQISAIYQYLERNISYTARKLHDRPQDPLLLGNTLLDL